MPNCQITGTHLMLGGAHSTNCTGVYIDAHLIGWDDGWCFGCSFFCWTSACSDVADGLAGRAYCLAGSPPLTTGMIAFCAAVDRAETIRAARLYLLVHCWQLCIAARSLLRYFHCCCALDGALTFPSPSGLYLVCAGFQTTPAEAGPAGL